jgi:hypothetical protein
VVVAGVVQHRLRVLLDLLEVQVAAVVGLELVVRVHLDKETRVVLVAQHHHLLLMVVAVVAVQVQ